MREPGEALDAHADRLRDNAILSRLPENEFAQLSGRSEVVLSEIRQRVYEPGQPVLEVYFPLSAVFSMVAVTENGSTVEVATIGREGMVGLPLFLGAMTSPQAAFCQIPGDAVRLTAGALREVLGNDGHLHRLLNRFTQASMVQIAQNVVCNNSHTVEQRAARWMLMTHDRVSAAQFSLTQEFLAQMLGVRRPTVSETAARLQERDLIRYHRGIMTITDRPTLETISCGCYRVVRTEFDALTH